MQQHMAQLEEELKKTKEQLYLKAKERDQAVDELREMKMVALEANMKLSEEFSSRKVTEELSKSKRQLNLKDRIIESLKVELEKAKEFEVRLLEKDVLFDKLKEDLSKSKAHEAQAMALLSENTKQVQELEDEVERGKMSETKMFDSVVSQTKQLEQTKIELEESKLEVTSLREKIKKFDSSYGNFDSTEEAFESLRSELQVAKENLSRAQEGEKVALSKAKRLLEDIDLLKIELKSAFEAEEKSNKAMDDLALALTEVATEANQAKEKLISNELELEHVKQEAEQLKEMLRSIEGNYGKLLEESNKETEQYKNTVERLRLEAEESILAWNDKEIGFVDCIKEAEEERATAQNENRRLVESLREAENLTKASREENVKLRDILKQALNEANVAKEASGIASVENSQLKDTLAEKDEALEFLARENERLRINEAASNESIEALKTLVSSATKTEEEKNQGRRVKSRNSSSVVEELKTGKNLNTKAISFDLSELKIPNEREDLSVKVVDVAPVEAETLKGSIFDTTADSPRTEPQMPPPLHRRVSASFTNGGETVKSENLDHVDGSHFDDTDHSTQRKKRALIQRFGDLLKRKNLHKKEPSIE